MQNVLASRKYFYFAGDYNAKNDGVVSPTVVAYTIVKDSFPSGCNRMQETILYGVMCKLI
jgi:hypothetical protein